MEGNNAGTEQTLTEALRRLERSLRRQPFSHNHHSRGKMRFLRLLAGHGGASARELAELMDIRPSSLAELLAKLEKGGLIRRDRDENDLRVVRIHLEEAGHRKLAEMESNAILADAFSDILTGKEKDTLIELCNKLSDGLEKRRRLSGGEMDDNHHKHDDRHGRHVAHCGGKHGSYGHKAQETEAYTQSEVD